MVTWPLNWTWNLTLERSCQGLQHFPIELVCSPIMKPQSCGIHYLAKLGILKTSSLKILAFFVISMLMLPPITRYIIWKKLMNSFEFEKCLVSWIAHGSSMHHFKFTLIILFLGLFKFILPSIFVCEFVIIPP